MTIRSKISAIKGSSSIPPAISKSGNLNYGRKAYLFRGSSLGVILLFLLLICITIVILQVLTTHHKHHHSHVVLNPATLLNLKHIPIEILGEENSEISRIRNPNCSYWDCFNVYKCGHHGQQHNRIGIYVYPLKNYLDANNKVAAKLTKEYYYILKAIIESDYYTPNPNEACILVPSIDTLNQNNVDPVLVAKALQSLPFWANGENHLLFNFVPGVAPDFNTIMDVNTDRAIVAGSGFDTWSYRAGFDLSLPLYSSAQQQITLEMLKEIDLTREFLLISSQTNLFQNHRLILQNLVYENSDILVLQRCSPKTLANSVSDHENNSKEENKSVQIESHKFRCNYPEESHIYDFPNVLTRGEFCLVIRGVRLAQLALLESLASRCIPVIVADSIVLPFSEVLDWTLASIRVREVDLHKTVAVLREVTKEKRIELRRQGQWFYRQYFKSIRQLVTTSLDILNDRVFPHLAKTYLQWNIPQRTLNPLFLPLIAPKSQGFTAVILTYDRIDSLFTLIQKLSAVPSLQKILVIWNNQKKSPPHPTMFPKISKPLKVIQTKANKLSYRFYPYDEIETEAILTIDDDIVMLTADELDFGYEVWREFPDRIVGFPSRTHVWDNVTMRWRYESEWTNQISMVLTGAAFHHKVRFLCSIV